MQPSFFVAKTCKIVYFYNKIDINKKVSIRMEDMEMQQPIMLKVMSFNMKRNYFSFGINRWTYRMTRIEKIIKDYQPDIIGTQELTSKALQDMKEILTEYDYVGMGRNGSDKGEYTAIFYLKDKFMLEDYDTFWLSPTPDRPSRAWFAAFPRICTTCTLTLLADREKRLSIFNTHLDHMSYWSRVNSLKLITHKINEQYKKTGNSVLLMGDFNATPTSQTRRKWDKDSNIKREVVLVDSYKARQKFNPESVGRSYHGFRGNVSGKPIDYIFVSPDLRIQEMKICRDKVGNFFPSDHYPIVAKLEF